NVTLDRFQVLDPVHQVVEPAGRRFVLDEAVPDTDPPRGAKHAREIDVAGPQGSKGVGGKQALPSREAPRRPSGPIFQVKSLDSARVPAHEVAGMAAADGRPEHVEL